jgi:hypothetical protein
MTKMWVGAIAIIIVIGALTLFAYTSEQNALKEATQRGMKSTAGVMATQVHVADIANITPGMEDSEQYLAIARHLKTMRSMDDRILNVYILKVYPNMTSTFIVDDLYPDDPQGSARTGEVSTAPDQLEIFSALSGPTASKQPYTTKYGSFMSAYAPIDDSVTDSSGNTFAVLAIDVSAKEFENDTSKGGLILLTGFVSMVLAIGALFVFARRDEEKKA